MINREFSCELLNQLIVINLYVGYVHVEQNKLQDVKTKTKKNMFGVFFVGLDLEDSS